MKKKILLTTLLSASLLTTACSNSNASSDEINETTEASIDEGSVEIGGRGEGNAGGEDILQTAKANDEELQAILAETTSKFELTSYTSSETGETLNYYLYVPENYDESNEYPLLMFIPDASTVGKEAEYSLTQGYGAGVWVTDEFQENHPSFVIVPVFQGTVVNDQYEVSSEVELAVDVINYLSNNYSIDTDRIYTTGQSMGGMTSFALNLKYPDLFAASLFVGSQWDTSIMLPLKEQKFFYIVSEGDPKAYAGQTALMELFDENGVEYSSGNWDATLSSEEQDNNVYNMLEEGNNINFITFNEGTTYPEGMSSESSRSGEHMTSFDYAYKISAVREWLFNQTK